MTHPRRTTHLPPGGVNRRDFLSGVSVALTGAALSCGEVPEFRAEIEREGAEPYPPLRTGMRGSHPGSFETAHAMAHEGREWTAADTGESYDLVVVGAGISGLAAAHYFRKAAGPRGAHPAARQPRRLRRPREAQRVPARRPDLPDERRDAECGGPLAVR